ncbi:MAG: sugar ABC transporter permease [Chloroflexi bacterium]|nr:sugar ABC transporter permease [Chloroflexota bacterium]
MFTNSRPASSIAIPKTKARIRRRHFGLSRLEARDGWLSLMPFLLGVLLFWVGPMLFSLVMVTQEWKLVVPPKYIGLGNFQRLIHDPMVGVALWNTAYYTFLGVPLRLATAFALAMALNQGLRGTSILRTIFYLPVLLPAVANAVIWMQILTPDGGILNTILGRLGLPAVAWLYNPPLAKPVFIGISLWGVGPEMIIFLAALQNTPQEMLEAAKIDGAGAWARFVHITIPMVSPVILLNLTMGIIGSFQVFSMAKIMTNGGPQNATLFMVLYLYDTAWTLFRMGYACVLAWLLFAIIMVVTIIQLRITNRWIYYETA